MSRDREIDALKEQVKSLEFMLSENMENMGRLTKLMVEMQDRQFQHQRAITDLVDIVKIKLS